MGESRPPLPLPPVEAPQQPEDGFRRTWKRFGVIFRRIRKNESLRSGPAEEMRTEMFTMLSKAAISKCLDFNILVNRVGRRPDETFALVSNLRGISEDLISLVYFSRFDRSRVQELIQLLLRLNLVEGVATQAAFFANNNPLQMVFGGGISRHQAERNISEARGAIREFWGQLGSNKLNGPTIRDMAKDIGLSSTYEYIYYVASNFVHFNPANLLRTGWGDLKGPFDFSLRHMSPYYQAFASFYGCILFIGFHSAFSPQYFTKDLSKEIARLIKLINDVQRWPEIITFEEMNQGRPLFFALHAARKVMQEGGEPMPYGAILKEVRSIRALIPL
jgi:hypothetical protein